MTPELDLFRRATMSARGLLRASSRIDKVARIALRKERNEIPWCRDNRDGYANAPKWRGRKK